ncbi:TPA: Dot/Icm T4SS effector RvfA [Legionella pneumophila]|nr:Dot/Icm T4SS effector RvfA [Legionella pneumophila]HDO7832151.1 Dot/Icm T4SS effector RvfA [Legionella pneumophila]HDO7844695.1 Dot/Icm T4SS effector RvfA [Legionella pneumophila]HDO9789195.1 Dot/Icm T4SS effector RvfA [Legionella pneumophila]
MFKFIYCINQEHIMSITIHTCKGGTKGLGFKTPVKSTLFGGNVGHAALELTWPANKQGDELAKKYAQAHGVIISKRTEIVGETQEEGRIMPKERVTYFAYFSWWPGEQNGHYINSFNDDKDAEWRHEPDKKMHADWKNQIYGPQGMSEENTTDVKGILIKNKNIQKLKTIQHSTLTADIAQDKAYNELLQHKEKLDEEYKSLHAKAVAYQKEKENAIREEREINPNFELLDEDISRMGDLPREFSILEAQLNLCIADFNERHLSSGKKPDSSVILPTSMDETSLNHTLDTESILREMITLANSEKAYNFTKFNCSTSVCHIVKAGVDEKLKENLSDNGFNINRYVTSYITTPTNVNALGLKLQDALLKLELAEHTKEAEQVQKPVANTISNRFNEFKSRLQAVVSERNAHKDDTEEVTINNHNSLR